MILADFISFLKIGANIILAVLGFISFEDINLTTSQSNDNVFPLNTKNNFVEKVTPQENELLRNVYYADKRYFVDYISDSAK